MVVVSNGHDPGWCLERIARFLLRRAVSAVTPSGGVYEAGCHGMKLGQ
jgi:hypothetical protein